MKLLLTLIIGGSIAFLGIKFYPQLAGKKSILNEPRYTKVHLIGKIQGLEGVLFGPEEKISVTVQIIENFSESHSNDRKTVRVIAEDKLSYGSASLTPEEATQFRDAVQKFSTLKAGSPEGVYETRGHGESVARALWKESGNIGLCFGQHMETYAPADAVRVAELLGEAGAAAK